MTISTGVVCFHDYSEWESIAGLQLDDPDIHPGDQSWQRRKCLVEICSTVQYRFVTKLSSLDWQSRHCPYRFYDYRTCCLGVGHKSDHMPVLLGFAKSIMRVPKANQPLPDVHTHDFGPWLVWTKGMAVRICHGCNEVSQMAIGETRL